MERIEKTVFVSYRRTNVPWALNVYQNLTHHGYDVFFDYEGIGSGDFESVILGNITSRAHFLVLLTPSALERCGNPGDWLRREIETAIESKRNIVPLMLEGFSFGTPAIANQLTGSLAALRSYNGIGMPAEYFLAAMEKLRTKFLNVPLAAVLQPATPIAKKNAAAQKAAADEAPPVQEEELTAQQYFERGVASSDLEEEIRFNNEAIRLKPDFAEAYNNRGTAREAQGDFAGALVDYDEAIRLKPDLAEAYNNRGNARGKQGDFVGALMDYDEAIRLRPAYVEAYNNRGTARQAQGDLTGALVDYGEAIRLKPDYANAYYNRGIARETRGDFAGALVDYGEAIRLKPDYANAYYNRGTLLKQMKQHAGAIADFQRYLSVGGGTRDGDTEEVEGWIRGLRETLSDHPGT